MQYVGFMQASKLYVLFKSVLNRNRRFKKFMTMFMWLKVLNEDRKCSNIT